jgi:two-component system cell cycle sensor histidine kinase/response regulator CckA
LRKANLTPRNRPLKTARNLRERYGDIRLLFMSGYAEEQLRETISLDNVSFLAKPFSVQQIAEAVHDALVKAN